MATYDNSYAIKINPATPNLRGLTTNYNNTGQVNLGGIGLGDLYELDYDRDSIEKVFNQGTDAQYALMQKENKIAQNQYANNQFANQQSAIETLRQQRNEQIASGMARGLNAAQEQGTILGLQQEGAAGALELANKQQLAADEIAAAYAENVVKALEEANAVKQAMAGISAQLYEADMLGYTGELSAAAQMDANASNRYGSELGYEGTIYTADKNYQAAIDAANVAAGAQIHAAAISAEAQKAAAKISASGGYSQQQATVELEDLYRKYWNNKEAFVAELEARNVSTAQAKSTWDTFNTQYKGIASAPGKTTSIINNSPAAKQSFDKAMEEIYMNGQWTNEYGYTYNENNITDLQNYLLHKFGLN